MQKKPRSTLTKICENPKCGRAYPVSPAEMKFRRFCSHACSASARMQRMAAEDAEKEPGSPGRQSKPRYVRVERVCAEESCRKPFLVPPSSNQKFCSRGCASRSLHNRKPYAKRNMDSQWRETMAKLGKELTEFPLPSAEVEASLRDLAWEEVRKQIVDAGHSAKELNNYREFFLCGWRAYREGLEQAFAGTLPEPEPEDEDWDDEDDEDDEDMEDDDE